MSVPPTPGEPLLIAGRYRLLRVLGEGTFGTVYEADDLRGGERVALKLLRPASGRETATERQALARQEAQVATQLQHPNIVRVRDIAEHDGRRFLAMDLVQGLGLDRLIATEGRIAAARASAIVAQVADALEAAHGMGVVHRDIKPANILLAADDHVRLTDFGVAVLAWSASSAGEPRNLQGTPAYMSPEQARGHDLDGRSDLFSLGCVLYEALSGARAFQSDSITGLIFKVITESPPPIASRVPFVPAALAAVVERALKKDPADRYDSAARMAAGLRAAV